MKTKLPRSAHVPLTIEELGCEYITSLALETAARYGAPTLGSNRVLRTPWAKELLSLKHGWDSYGGHPISTNAIATIGEFRVVPCSDGGVQLEIHRDGWDIEITICQDGHIESGSIEYSRQEKP